jgi:hypothetical protein
MNEISNKRLILCSMAGTLLAGFVLIIFQIIIIGILFFAASSGYLTESQTQSILESFPNAKKVPSNSLPPLAKPTPPTSEPTKAPVFDYYTIIPKKP